MSPVETKAQKVVVQFEGRENHAHMMVIYFMHYNFVRIHQTLKMTPAMAAGVTSPPGFGKCLIW